MAASVSTMHRSIALEAVLDQEGPLAHLPQCDARAGAVAAGPPRWPTGRGGPPPPPARRATGHRPRGSPSPREAPGPAPPAPSPMRRPSADPTPGAGPRHWTRRRRGRASTTTAASAPRPGSTGSPRPRRPRGRSGPVPTVSAPPPAAVRASAACNQAVAHAIRTPSAADEYSAERSRTTSGAERSRPDVVGPSNMPQRSPCTSRRSSSATSRPSSSRSRRSVRSARAASSLGASRASTTTGTVGTAVDTVASAKRRPQRGALAGRQPPAEARAGQGGEQLHPAAPRGVGTGPGVTVVVGPGIERIEADGTTGSQGHRSHAPRVGQVAVLALGVDHPGPATEHRLAPQEGLDERALAPTDLAEHDHVRVGHHAGRVELEGVEDERAAEQVVADHHATAAEARLGDERVGRAEVARGHLMGRQTGHALPHGR